MDFSRVWAAGVAKSSTKGVWLLIMYEYILIVPQHQLLRFIASSNFLCDVGLNEEKGKQFACSLPEAEGGLSIYAMLLANRDFLVPGSTAFDRNYFPKDIIESNINNKDYEPFIILIEQTLVRYS